MTRAHRIVRTGLFALLLVAAVAAGGWATPVPAREPDPRAVQALAWLAEVVDDDADVGAHASLALTV